MSFLFSLTRLGCETTRCMHQYYFGLTTISFPQTTHAYEWQTTPLNGCGFYRTGLKMGVENDIFLVWNRVSICRTGWHPPPPAPTKNSQESTGISRPSHLSLFQPNRASLCWLHWNQTCLSLTLSFFRSLRQILKVWNWTKQELSKKRKEKLLLQRLNSTNR